MYRIGIHLSIGYGLSKVPKRVHGLGLNSFQIFSHNPRSWKITPLKDAQVEGFKRGVLQYQLWPVVVHINYLVNLSSPDEVIYQRSLQVLKESLRRCHLLGANYLVLHPGNHRGLGVEKGIEQVVEALKSLDQGDLTLLLENTSGAGTQLGSTFRELGAMVDGIQGRVGICFDTCHAFVAGYDLRSKEALEKTLRDFQDHIGVERLLLIHANDAKGDLASKRDHHHHIGEGFIGKDAFRNLLNHPLLKEVPFILETPQREKGDAEKNISQLFSLLSPEGRLYEDR